MAHQMSAQLLWLLVLQLMHPKRFDFPGLQYYDFPAISVRSAVHPLMRAGIKNFRVRRTCLVQCLTALHAVCLQAH